MPPVLLSCLVLLFLWTHHHIIIPLRVRKILQAHPLKQSTVSQGKNYIRRVIPTLSFGGFALIVGFLHRIPVFGSIHIDAKISLGAIGFLVLNMLCIDPLEWKFTPFGRRQRLLIILPNTAEEKLAWIPVSLIVAVGEEIIYRAVFFGLFYQLTGNYWGAAILSAILFAIAHQRYGLAATASTFFVALGLQYFVKNSGGLYVPIAIHFTHNFLNGIIYGALAKRESNGDIAENLLANNIEMAATQQPDRR